MTPTSVLAIDAGQTTMKVRVGGAPDAREHGFPGIRTSAPLAPQLAQVARAVIDEGGSAEVLAAGVSGVTDAAACAAELAGLLHGSAVREVVVAHDSTTSYLGALGTGRGAVVASGTGVVTLAVGRSDVARVDGWGHTMGDAGSGFWIGRRALVAVMRAYDGRGPATSLTEAVQERWPVLPDAYIRLQSDPDWVRQVASFARVVAEHSAAGDEVATGITADAAAELALSVATGLRLVGADHDPDARVCAIGGVFASRMLQDRFDERLAASGIAATPVGPLGAGIDGALALATLPAEHPFTAHIGDARVP